MEKAKNLSLLRISTTQPELLAQLDIPTYSATACRTISMPMIDCGGNYYLNLKGVYPILNSDTPEVKDHFRWEIYSRRPKHFNGIAGKEISSQSNHEVSAFDHLCKIHPWLNFDLNAPFWRPLAVAAASGLIATEDNWPEDKGDVSVDQAVVTMRRFPFTPNRLDEYVEHQMIPPRSVMGFNELKRKWGIELDEYVFFRAINRWGHASRLLLEANLLHGQTFLICKYPQLGSAAWMNFNNIAIDGSTGDLDMTTKVTEKYLSWQLNDSFGGAMMYLMFIYNFRPKLIESDDFLVKFFSYWKKGIGNFVRFNNSVFDEVISGIELLSKSYSTMTETRPGRNNLGYLEYHSRQKLAKAGIETTRRVRQLRHTINF